MLVHISNQTPNVKSRYLDPQLIAQTLFTYPNKWELDDENLAAGETIEEKEEIRLKRIKEESYKVAAYITRAFDRMQE
jgi:phosphoribosylaminoimidazole-succinocarboxamide synthase